MGQRRPWVLVFSVGLGLSLSLGLSGLGLSCAQASFPQPSTNLTQLTEGIPYRGLIRPNGRQCFLFHMDLNTRRQVVYWEQPKLYIRLEPCSGMPHLLVSVYGCPGDGHQVNWEYQSEYSRSEQRSRGQTPPKDWEWPGDTETLSIPVTHASFYIEVVQYHRPLDTYGDLVQLERDLRFLGMEAEAENISVVTKDNTTDFNNLKNHSHFVMYQEMLMPDASFELTGTLHEASVVPTAKIRPMASNTNWDKELVQQLEAPRALSFQDDEKAGWYTVVFWPPTRTFNLSANEQSGGSLGNLTTLRRDSERKEEGSEDAGGAAAERSILWAPGEGIGGLGTGGVQLGANPSSSEGAAALMRRQAAVERQRTWSQALKDTESKIDELRRRGIKGVEEALQNFEDEFEQHRETANINRRHHSHLRDTESATIVPVTLEEKAAYKTKDEDLEFKFYYLEITQAFRDRWGTMLELQTGMNRTRLFNKTCTPPAQMDCGALQWIVITEFEKMDKDGSGQVSKQEYEAVYPPARHQTKGNGFVPGQDFDQAAGGDKQLSFAEWDKFFALAGEILEASVKDPLARTLWTVCGVEKYGTLMPPDGNLSNTANDTWTPIRDVVQLEDGRFQFVVKGFKDTDNNIYLINVLVRNKVTGEVAAYNFHTVQRRTPVYAAPDVGGPEIGLIVGISVGVGIIVILIAVAVAFTRNKKMRPRLRIRKKG